MVNDCAECGVAAISAYCNILTTDTEKRKWLINTVETHKSKYPDFEKATLNK